MVVVPQGRIGTRLRMERTLHMLHAQSPLTEQISQHAVFKQKQTIRMKFHRHMTIAQVVSGLKQGQRMPASHLHQRLNSSLNNNLHGAVIADQAIAWLQRFTTRQLQHQAPAALGETMPPNAAALIRWQRHLEMKFWRCSHGTWLNSRHQKNRGLLRHIDLAMGSTLMGRMPPLCDHRYQKDRHRRQA